MSNKLKAYLSDGRQAEIIGGINGGGYTTIVLPDGRQVSYPVKDLRFQEINIPEKEEIEMVVLPAIERLQEFTNDIRRIRSMDDFRDNIGMTDAELDLFNTLLTEAENELKRKWRL